MKIGKEEHEKRQMSREEGKGSEVKLERFNRLLEVAHHPPLNQSRCNCTIGAEMTHQELNLS
jgi:hypothetical protein